MLQIRQERTRTQLASYWDNFLIPSVDMGRTLIRTLTPMLSGGVSTKFFAVHKAAALPLS